MKTIKDEKIETIEVKKSKFIAFCFHVSHEEEIKEKIEKIRKEHKTARHVAYAYKLNNIEKYDDDKEPNKTAGFPILEIINYRELSNLLIVVVRYFGGIKLGAGGLTRAYAQAATNVLDSCDEIKLTDGYEISVMGHIKDYNTINHLLITKNIKILKKEISDYFKLIIEIKKNNLEQIVNEIKGKNHEIKIEIIKERMVVDRK